MGRKKKKETEQLIKDITPSVKKGTEKTIAGVTGLVVSSKEDYVLAGGRVLQAIIKGKFWDQFCKEWKSFVRKGIIQDDYTHTGQSMNCLHEIFEALNNDSLDEEKFKALKNLFLNIASEKHSNRNDVFPLELIKICRQLSAGEVLILKACYSQIKDAKHDKRKEGGLMGAQVWVSEVVEKTGLGCSEIVTTYEKKLIEKEMISPRIKSSSNIISYNDYGRLTGLGNQLCLFIEELP